ncbi:YkgJ family cysteine cluster protein [Planctomycetota bacterium]
MMDWLLLKNVIKGRRAGLLHLAPADKPMRLDCLAEKCAECCKYFGGPAVTSQEAERIGSEAIITRRNALFVKSQNGICCVLKAGLCSRYAARPKGCREYPWYNIDGRLYYDAGCPGIKFDKDERPEVKDIQPFENFFPGTPKLLVRILKYICITSK